MVFFFQNSEGYLHNGSVSGKRIKLDHSPDLPNILSRSKLHSVSQSSSPESEHQYFANLQRNLRVRADSDSFQLNSENIDSFQQLGNNGSVERRPLSELRVLSPDSHSIYSDDR